MGEGVIKTASFPEKDWSHQVTSFKHSGDIGDVIWSLPTIKHLGGGRLFLSQSKDTRILMGPESIRFIKPLLERQPYISEVERWTGSCVCYDFDPFRQFWMECERHHQWASKSSGTHLAEWHARLFGVPLEVISKAWVECEKKPIAPVVFARSERYRVETFPWKEAVRKYSGRSVFLGLQEEHQAFESAFGSIPFHKVKDALEMAEIINGSKLFISNQGFPDTLAEALKKPKIQEPYSPQPTCVIARPDAQYAFTRNIYYPEV